MPAAEPVSSHFHFTAAVLTLQRQRTSYASVQVPILAYSARMFMPWDCPADQLSKPWDWAQLQVQPVCTSQVMQAAVCTNTSIGFANSKKCSLVRATHEQSTHCSGIALQMDHSYQAADSFLSVCINSWPLESPWLLVKS